MDRSRRYEVAIVGAGPAGSLLGYYLGQKNIPTLIIEKKKLPRPKVCGGGLTKRTLDILPFDIESVVEDVATTATLSVKNHTVFSKTYPYPITALVMRDRFDHLLVQHAVDKGCILMDGTEFMGFTGPPGNMTVHTSSGSIRAGIVIGADGIHSRVASRLGLGIRNKQMIAVEAEAVLKQPNQTMDRFRHTIQFDIGQVPNGYGWVFPKKNHLSIGILSLSKKTKGIRNDLFAFINAKKLDHRIESLSYRGHGIPYGPNPNNRYANDYGLLIGDATGIVDPITGEGIYYAVRGARLAAETITGHLGFGKPLRAYDRLLKRHLFPEIGCAQKLAFILYKCEKLSHRALRTHGMKIAQNHVNIITGAKTYRQLFREIFTLRGLRIILGLK